MNEFHYQSPLKAFIEGMIREKRSLGYKYISSARILYRFDQFCLTYGGDDALITQPLAHAWIQKAPNEAPATLHNRACVLRQLALYMTRLGIPSYVLPKKALPKVPAIRLTFLAIRKSRRCCSKQMPAIIVLKCR